MSKKTNADLALFNSAEGGSPPAATGSETGFIGGPVRKSEDLGDKKRPKKRTEPSTTPRSRPPMTLEQAEAVLVRQALAKHAGDPHRAAHQLGLSLEALSAKRKLLGL